MRAEITQQAQSMQARRGFVDAEQCRLASRANNPVKSAEIACKRFTLPASRARRDNATGAIYGRRALRYSPKLYTVFIPFLTFDTAFFA